MATIENGAMPTALETAAAQAALTTMRSSAQQTASTLRSALGDIMRTMASMAPMTLPALDPERLKAASANLREYNEELMTQYRMAALSDKEQAGQKAYEETITKAKAAKIKDAEAVEALAQYNRHLAEATDDVAEAQKRAAAVATAFNDTLAQGIGQTILGLSTARDAFKDFAKQIAATLIQKQIAEPLANSLTGLLGGGIGKIFSGLGSLLPFADGGDPPVGVPSLVGERGPEIFVPKLAGTILPNHALGGTSVIVNQHFTMSPGLQGTVEAEVRRAAPFIAAQAHDAVFASIQRGGSAAKIVGRR